MGRLKLAIIFSLFRFQYSRGSFPGLPLVRSLAIPNLSALWLQGGFHLCAFIGRISPLCSETVKTVETLRALRITLLKQGVNERERPSSTKMGCARTKPSALRFAKDSSFDQLF